MKLLGKYRNGNYNVLIYEDGTKIRFNDLDNLTPSFAESYDISVTEKCDGNCQWCYLGCNEQGKHGNLNLPFFNTLHPYTEIAINGNDLSHPDLEDFLIRMKDQKVISNMTVNQKHFERHYNKIKDWQDRGLLHGIGVSLVNSKTLDLKEMKNVVVHTIAGLLTEEDINKLKNRGVKLLILGYKILGRGDEYYYKNKERIESNIKWLSHNIMNIQEWFDVISFDNLSLEQLNMKSKIDPKLWDMIYMGDEGEFTYFVSVTDNTFSQSSLELQYKWPVQKSVDAMFKVVQKYNYIKNNTRQFLLNNNICIDNEWFLKYMDLIYTNLHNNKKRGYDGHHVIPKGYYNSLGIDIDNTDNNIVYLDKSSHMLAHLFLYLCASSDIHRYNNAHAIARYIGYFNKLLNTTNTSLNNLELIIKKYSSEINSAYTDFCTMQSEKYLGKKSTLTEKERKAIAQKVLDTRVSRGTTNKGKLGVVSPSGKMLFVEPNVLPDLLSKGWKRGRWDTSEETKKKISKTKTGVKIGPLSEEHKRKISEANKGKVIPLKQRKQISNTLKAGGKCGKNKGKICINNGSIMKYVTQEEYETQYKNWQRGRLSGTFGNGNKGKVRINDGKVAKYVTEEEFETIYKLDGWKRGWK